MREYLGILVLLMFGSSSFGAEPLKESDFSTFNRRLTDLEQRVERLEQQSNFANSRPVPVYSAASYSAPVYSAAPLYFQENYGEVCVNGQCGPSNAGFTPFQRVYGRGAVRGFFRR